MVEVNANNFEELVLKSATPVIVDFWANWCGPCRTLAPVLDKLDELSDSYSIVKVNVEADPSLAAQFSVYALPTLIVFVNGKEVRRRTGNGNFDTIRSFVEAQ